MRFPTLFALLAWTLSLGPAEAQNPGTPKPSVSPETLALYEPGTFKGMKYRLMKPIDFDPEKTYRLILSLHGAGGRGTANIKNLRDWNEWLTEESLRRKHPCYVLAPQSPTSWFDPASEHSLLPEPGSVQLEDLPEGMRKFGERALEAAKNPDDPSRQAGVLGKVFELIDTRLSRECRIDVDRVYCIGHSMGGAGTFTAVYQDPDCFAAAIPSAGIFFPWLDASRLQDVPLWIFHGRDDKVVDYIGSRHPFDRLRELGANAKLSSFTGFGHAPKLAFNYAGDDPDKGYLTEHASDRTDPTDQVWDWLFRQQRPDDAGLESTLLQLNQQLKNIDVELLEWPQSLQPKLGGMKRVAFLARPAKESQSTLPLLISLHGGGGKTMSLAQQLARSAEVKGLHLAELANQPLMLLEPNSADSWDPATLNLMLDHLLATRDDIDADRIYLIGHSMGGVGTWDWIRVSSERFAAAAPCGFPMEEPGDLTVLKDLPIWGMAGGADGTRTTGIRAMVEQLRKAGNPHVRHTEFPDASHSEGNAAVFSAAEVVEWMLGFSTSGRE